MILDLSFPVYGDAPVPADHEFLMYEALTSIVPGLRGSRDVDVFPLSGRRIGDRYLLLLPHSELTLRLPDIRIGEFLALSRSRLAVGHQWLRLGSARVRLPEDNACRTLRSGTKGTIKDVSLPLQMTQRSLGQ